MRQSRSKCNIFGQARRPAPTKTCRGDPLWSPGSSKTDFDLALVPGKTDLLFFQKYITLFVRIFETEGVKYTDEKKDKRNI